jgi:hypothetical protein
MRFLCDKNIADAQYNAMFMNLSPVHIVRLIVDRATKNIARYFYVNTYRDASVRPIDAEYCVQSLYYPELQKHMVRVMTHLMDEKGVGGKGGQTYYNSLMGETEIRPWNQSSLLDVPQLQRVTSPVSSLVNKLSVFRRREALMTQLRELLADLKNMDETSDNWKCMDVNQ